MDYEEEPFLSFLSEDVFDAGITSSDATQDANKQNQENKSSLRKTQRNFLPKQSSSISSNNNLVVGLPPSHTRNPSGCSVASAIFYAPTDCKYYL